MKKLVIIFVCLFSSMVYAQSYAPLESAQEVAYYLNESLASSAGFYGTTVTTCDPVTGEFTLGSVFTYCAAILVDNSDSHKIYKEQFPTGSQLTGVYVEVLVVDDVTSNPRITIRN